jgi:FKBP-type peptidyl-prolyl cis-trans isomerase
MITTASGLKYADLKVGHGPAAEPGKRIVFHYTGWLDDGTKSLRG